MRLAVLIVPRAPLHIRHQVWSHQEYGDSAPDQNLTARQSYGRHVHHTRRGIGHETRPLTASHAQCPRVRPYMDEEWRRVRPRFLIRGPRGVSQARGRRAVPQSLSCTEMCRDSVAWTDLDPSTKTMHTDCGVACENEQRKRRMLEPTMVHVRGMDAHGAHFGCVGSEGGSGRCLACVTHHRFSGHACLLIVILMNKVPVVSGALEDWRTASGWGRLLTCALPISSPDLA